MSELTISVIDDATSFAAMRDEWNELLAASEADSIFLTWEWLHTWWKHCANGRLFFIAVRSGQQLAGIAPLMRTRSWTGPVLLEKLEFAGSGTIGSDYLDFIVRGGFEDVVMPVVEEFIAHRGMTLRLTRMKRTAIATRETGPRLWRKGWQVVSTPAEVCPFIDLPADFDSFLATLGSSHRYNYKRRLKNLQRDFDMRVVRATTDEERRDALDTVIGLHLARWSARGGSDAFNSADALLTEREAPGVADIKAIAERAERTLGEDIARIGEIALPAEHSLARAIHRSTGHIEYHFKKLTERAIRGLVRKDRERYAVAKELVSALYPDRHVQDRIVNWFALSTRFGDAMLPAIVDAVQPDDASFRIVGL